MGPCHPKHVWFEVCQAARAPKFQRQDRVFVAMEYGVEVGSMVFLLPVGMERKDRCMVASV